MPEEIDVASQTTPAHTVGSNMGAVSAYDPSPSQDVSRIAFDNALGAFTANLEAGPQEVSGVQRTVTPGYATPITWHTAGVSYEIPVTFGG